MVLQYNGTTGQFLKTFIPAGSGLNRPIGLVFGQDGNLYVCNYGTNSVLRFNGSTGASMGTFTSGGTASDLSGPAGLAFGLDGNLYVSGYLCNKVVQYNGTTGAFIKDFVVAGTNGVPAGAPAGRFGLSFYLEAPTGLTATLRSPSEIDLSWINNSPDATAVEVWRKVGTGSYSPRAVLGASAVSYADTAVIPNTTYTYIIRADNVSGASPWSNQPSMTTLLAAPAAPSNLTTSALTSAAVTLNWTNHATNATAVAIFRQDASGAWTRVGVVSPSTAGFTDLGVSPNATYSYRIRATNTLPSDWSNLATVTTGGS